MADTVVDLDHWRRAQRLLPILVDRHGLRFFLDVDADFPSPPALDEERVSRAADVAADWIERRSGREVDAHGRAALRRLLSQLLIDRLRAGAAVRR